jgi:hypothetical protein
MRALLKAGFRLVRQGKHVVMTDGVRILTIPRHDPVNGYTMGGIVRDAGLSIKEFRRLLLNWQPMNVSSAPLTAQARIVTRLPSVAVSRRRVDAA